MTRIKGGLVKSKKHKKVLTATKGYRGAKHRLVRTAKEALMHAGEYAFSGRKQRKRQKRSLWITKLSNFLKAERASYNTFIHSLNEANIKLDRKILSELATNDPEIFRLILKKGKVPTN